MKNPISSKTRLVFTRLKAINCRHMVLLIILAEIVTGIMNTIMGNIRWGSISYDLILIDAVDALVASLVVGTTAFVSLATFKNSTERNIHAAEHVS